MNPLRTFGPWFAYGIGAAALGWRPAAVLALALGTALLLAGGPAARRDAFTKTAVVFFAGLSLVAVVAPTSGVHRYVPALIPLALAAAALWTVATGRPFTIAFAQRVAPPEYWGTPLFMHINRALSMVWAASFALTGCVMAGVLAFAPNLAGALILVQVAAFVVPMRICRWYPAVARSRSATV